VQQRLDLLGEAEGSRLLQQLNLSSSVRYTPIQLAGALHLLWPLLMKGCCCSSTSHH